MAINELKQIKRDDRKALRNSNEKVLCFFLEDSQVFEVNKKSLASFIKKNGQPDSIEEIR